MEADSLVKRSAVVSAVVLAMAAGVFLAGYFGQILLLVFAGMLLGVLLHSIISVITDHVDIKRGFAFAVVAILFLLLLGITLASFGPLFIRGMNQLVDTVSGVLETVLQALRTTRWGESVLSGSAGGASSLISSAFSTVTGFVSAALWSASAALIILFTGLYTAAEPSAYIDNFIRLFPPQRRGQARSVIAELGGSLRWWLVGRLSSMAVVGVLTWLGLMLLGMPLAVTLAVLAALLSFIPNIGPVLSAVPAILIGFDQSPATALNVTILYIVVQTVESYFITPLIQRRAVELPPGVVITAQILVAYAYGPLGLLVATPLTVVAVVLTRRLYLSRYSD